MTRAEAEAAAEAAAEEEQEEEEAEEEEEEEEGRWLQLVDHYSEVVHCPIIAQAAGISQVVVPPITSR